MWLVIGLPAAFVASRLPLARVRAWPTRRISFSLVLLLATAFVGVDVNGNTELARRRPARDPALRGRQARAGAVGGPHLRQQGAPPAAACTSSWCRWCRGCCWPRGLVVVGRDLGTALVLFAILLGMLWVVGAPARLFSCRAWLVGVVALALAATDTERLARITTFVDPFKDFHGTGLAARPRAVRALERRLLRPGHRRQPAEVGRPARGAHRLHLRGARRGARPGRHAAGRRRCSSPSPTPRCASRASTRTRSCATRPSASWCG